MTDRARHLSGTDCARHRWRLRDRPRDQRAAGGRAEAYAASVDDADAMSAMVTAAIAADLGLVDLLVCNAGVASRGHSVADTDPVESVRVRGYLTGQRIVVDGRAGSARTR